MISQAWKYESLKFGLTHQTRELFLWKAWYLYERQDRRVWPYEIRDSLLDDMPWSENIIGETEN